MIRRILVVLVLISSLGFDIYLSRSFGLPQPGIVLIPLITLMSLLVSKIDYRILPIWLLILVFAGLISSILHASYYRSASYIILFLFSIALASSVQILYKHTGTVRIILLLLLTLNFVFLFSQPIGRFGGIWDNANMAGIALFAMWVLVEKLNLSRLFFAPLSILIFATLSRSSILLLVIFFASCKRFNIKEKIIIGVVGLCAVVFLVGTLVNSYNLNPALIQRLEIFSGQGEVVMSHDNSKGGRIDVIQEYLGLIKNRPLLGYGAGFSGSKKIVHTAAHNFYLMLCVDFGLIVAFTVLFFIVLDLFKSNIQRSTFFVLFMGIFYHDIIFLRSILLIMFISNVRDIS